MTIGIVIPLKAKSVSREWSTVEECLFNTLVSLENQSDKNFQAIVVGHDCPSYLEDRVSKFSANISFFKFEDKPPPEITASNTINQDNFELDRCLKIYKGYKILLENYSITKLFSLDADDLVRDDFVRFLIKVDSNTSVLIEKGYVFYKNRKVVNKINNFSSYCGSSFISSVSFIQKNQADLDFNSFIFRKVGHVSMKDYLLENKVKFITPEESLIMYVRDNGENISRPDNASFLYLIRRTIKLNLKRKFFAKKILSRFSL